MSFLNAFVSCFSLQCQGVGVEENSLCLSRKTETAVLHGKVRYNTAVLFSGLIIYLLSWVRHNTVLATKDHTIKFLCQRGDLFLPLLQSGIFHLRIPK